MRLISLNEDSAFPYFKGDFACQIARMRSRVVSEFLRDPGAEACGNSGASAAAFFTRM